MDRRVDPARVLAVLYIAGASLALLSLVLPHPPERERLLHAIIALAYVVGVGLAIWSRSASRWAVQVLLAVGTALIGTAIYAGEVTGGIYGFMFFWVAVFV